MTNHAHLRLERNEIIQDYRVPLSRQIFSVDIFIKRDITEKSLLRSLTKEFSTALAYGLGRQSEAK